VTRGFISVIVNGMWAYPHHVLMKVRSALSDCWYRSLHSWLDLLLHSEASMTTV
jgi:hypothetical protein